MIILISSTDMCRVLTLTLIVQIICLTMTTILLTTIFLYFTTPSSGQSYRDGIKDLVPGSNSSTFCRPFHHQSDQESFECTQDEGDKILNSRYCCNNNFLQKWTCCTHKEWMTMMTLEQTQVSTFSNWLYACIAVSVFIILALICWLLYIFQICYLWVALGCRPNRQGYQEI